MNSHEFLLTQIEAKLRSEGFSDYASKNGALHGLDYYKRSAHFKRSALEDSIKQARAKAKEIEPAKKKALQL